MTVEERAPASLAFDGVARTAAGHFELYLLAAVLRLRDQLPGIDDAAADRAFPFFRGYVDQLPAWARGGAPGEAWARWCAAIGSWEASIDGHLPLRAIRDATGLDDLALTILFLSGLVDEDDRFGRLYDVLQPGHGPRPSAGLLAGWSTTPEERRRARGAVGQLAQLGLLEPAGPGQEESLRPAKALWSVLRGDPGVLALSWARVHPWEDAQPLPALILPPEVRRSVEALPDALREGIARAVVVRGAESGGRRMLLASLGRALGYGWIEVDAAELEPGHWLALGPLATALAAMPIVRVQPGIGQTVAVPVLRGYTGPLGYVLPVHGGVSGPDVERAVTVTIPTPGRADRIRHWQAAVPDGQIDDVDGIATRYRLAGGTIRRAAELARATARLDGRRSIAATDVQAAVRELRSRALESLAPRVPAGGGWNDLVTDAGTRAELLLLEARCRAREDLPDVLPPEMGVRSAGVRALFTGPSGTGKTLAARVLASALAIDLHGVDLSTVVDKYLGETEKNLTAVFDRAAKLDAILLLDEGDALLARRTDVGSSNDRYANLQTNHLLQRLEAHDGIVIVTTNAGERIDPAFQRRIDVVVEFRPPDASQRWELWQRHLPQPSEVDDAVLADVAYRCQLTGGQIRNAVLHAWLLAFERDPEQPAPMAADVEAAVRREYRKLGTICPLRTDGSGS
jgi:hypothetical protein